MGRVQPRRTARPRTGRHGADRLDAAHEIGLEIACVNSGPLGGDLQIGAMVAEGSIDMLIFFWGPLQPQPHDPDVKALLRIATLCDVPAACNRATADYLISSPLATAELDRRHRTDTPHQRRPARAR